MSCGDSVEGAMKQMLEKYKTCPDAVVNSAGITMDGYLLKMTDDRFDKVIDVNLKGTYRINKMAATAMKAAKLQYGSIVNISSIVGKYPFTISHEMLFFYHDFTYIALLNCIMAYLKN